MPVAVHRLQRLLRAEGLPTSPGVEAALARCVDELEVRARALALRRSLRLGGPDAPPTWLERLERWDRGGADPWLDEAARLALPVNTWLNACESLLELVGRTLSRCLERDLRHQPAARARATGSLAAWAAALCEASPPDVLRQAQRRLIDHPNPQQLTHFCRVWPDEASLAPQREVYLRLLDELTPGHALEESVVGCVDLLARGPAERWKALVDWPEVQRVQEAGAHTMGASTWPLRCGLRVSLDFAEAAQRPRFSAFELIEREAAQPPLTREPRDPVIEAPPLDPEALDTPPPPTLFPAIDRVLLTLGRSALGVHCPRGGGWLPPSPALPAAAPLPFPPNAAGLVRAGLRDELAWFALGPGASETTLDQLLSLALSLQPSPALPHLDAARARLGALSERDDVDRWIAAWSAAVFALCLWRWREGLRALLDHLPQHAALAPTLELPEVARVWLNRPPPERAPATRRRRPDGVDAPAGEDFNAFDLDLLHRLNDIELFYIVLSASTHPAELLSWGLNDWQLARRLAESLALRAADPEGGSRPHGSSVWVHHQLLSGPDRSLDAFKRTVSKEALLPWSLSELDEALALARPRTEALARFRASRAGLAPALPRRPWTAASCWSEAGRSLGWLIDWARGTGGVRP